MIVNLLTEHHLEFLSLIRGCRGSSESTLVKIPHGWRSHVAAQILMGGSNKSWIPCYVNQSMILGVDKIILMISCVNGYK